MEIEKAKLEQLEIINKIGVQCHNLHVNWRKDIFRKTNNIITEERLKFLIDTEKILVAVENEIVQGFMILDEKVRLGRELLVDKKYLVIDTIAIDVNFRRKGIGTKLLEYAEMIALKEGFTDLYLTVNEENTAGINNYEKFGFKVKNIAYSKSIIKE